MEIREQLLNFVIFTQIMEDSKKDNTRWSRSSFVRDLISYVNNLRIDPKLVLYCSDKNEKDWFNGKSQTPRLKEILENDNYKSELMLDFFKKQMESMNTDKLKKRLDDLISFDEISDKNKEDLISLSKNGSLDLFIIRAFEVSIIYGSTRNKDGGVILIYRLALEYFLEKESNKNEENIDKEHKSEDILEDEVRTNELNQKEFPIHKIIISLVGIASILGSFFLGTIYEEKKQDNKVNKSSDIKYENPLRISGPVMYDGGKKMFYNGDVYLLETDRSNFYKKYSSNLPTKEQLESDGSFYVNHEDGTLKIMVVPYDSFNYVRYVEYQEIDGNYDNLISRKNLFITKETDTPEATYENSENDKILYDSDMFNYNQDFLEENEILSSEVLKDLRKNNWKIYTNSSNLSDIAKKKTSILLELIVVSYEDPTMGFYYTFYRFDDEKFIVSDNTMFYQIKISENEE